MTAPSSSAPPIAASIRTRRSSTSNPSNQIVESTTSEDTPTVNSVNRRESTLSVKNTDSEKTSKRNFPSRFAAPGRYVWLTEQVPEDAPLTVPANPRYSSDLLQSSDLPLNSKMSLEKLTRSLQAVDRASSADLVRKGSGVKKSRSSFSRLALHKRSLSVQSLASTTSSVESGKVYF